MEYSILIGLEIHAQVIARQKAFCCCEYKYKAPPNTTVCPICLGHPGVMPALNPDLVRAAVITGKAMGCQVNLCSAFDRKHYFYHDLPKGYQITQHYRPVCISGRFVYPHDDGEQIAEIRQIHMEEDSGKSKYKGDELEIDYNRAGVPLLEIVTEPCFSSAGQASSFLKELRLCLRYLNVCSGDMEKGALRCDANISVAKHGESSSDIVEIKNLNSIKNIRLALRYEIKKQSNLLKQNRKVERETRGWSESEKHTYTLRSKEQLRDYRHMPEPDLPDLLLTQEYIDDITSALPILPMQKRDLMARQYGLNREAINALISSKRISDLFLELAGATDFQSAEANNKLAWILLDYADAIIKYNAPEQIIKNLLIILKSIKNGKIDFSRARNIFREYINNGRSTDKLLAQAQSAASSNQIREILQQIITQSPDAVEKYRNGRTKLIGFFIGHTLQELGNTANPEQIKSIAEEMLNGYTDK